MLYEIDASLIAQKNCRWFRDEEMDLYVWYSPEKTITRFQLCYNRMTHEHALVWSSPGSWAHYLVDSGETNPLYNQAPLLLATGPVLNPQALAQQFSQHSFTLEPDLKQFILAQLEHYSTCRTTSQ